MATALSTWTDGYWWSNDGLRLHYRDDAGSSERPPILCRPGLTRNARDFETVAARLAPEWRVLVVDLRGRGESAYTRDSITYVPLVYVQDIDRLLEDLGIDRFVAFGTSLGGIVTMLLAATGRARLAGALLNDVGPNIETRELDRIRVFDGRQGAYSTGLHAARGIAQSNAEVFPDYDLTDWLVVAKRLDRLSANSRIVPDYDKRIAEPFRLPAGEAGIDLWPALDTLASVPTPVVRGEPSDLLATATVELMLGRLFADTSVTVPRVVYAPVLDEPVASAAIDALLARVV